MSLKHPYSIQTSMLDYDERGDYNQSIGTLLLLCPYENYSIPRPGLQQQIIRTVIYLYNMDIRQETTAAGLKLWMIAERLGMADFSFSRKLRHELPDTDKARIREIISELSAEQEAENGEAENN